MRRNPWRTERDEHGRDADEGRGPTRYQAARWAAVAWLILLLAHVAAFIAAALSLGFGSGGWRGAGFGWASIVLAIALVLGTWGRGELFKRYWVGDVVQPRGYLVGHLLVWLLLLVATVVALIFCFVHGVLWPTAVVILVALFMHAITWPRAAAMAGDE